MVTATLTVCERGGTVSSAATDDHSTYGGCSHLSGFKRSDLFADCQQNDMILTPREPSVKMVRARRVESESSELLASTAMMTYEHDRHDDRDQRHALEGRARSFPVSQVSRRRPA